MKQKIKTIKTLAHRITHDPRESHPSRDVLVLRKSIMFELCVNFALWSNR